MLGTGAFGTCTNEAAAQSAKQYFAADDSTKTITVTDNNLSVE